VRKVVVYQLLSLDGVAEKPETLVAEWGEVMDANLATIIAAQDAVVLGRRSFDEWSRYWPDSADIGVHASISVAQSLLRAGVVDELRLVWHPLSPEADGDCWTRCRRSGSSRFARPVPRPGRC